MQRKEGLGLSMTEPLSQGSTGTLQSLQSIATQSGRVCLHPKHWQALYDLLPDTHRDGARWVPPLPLILAGWANSSDADKAARFNEHLRWAVAHGAGGKVEVFLCRLPEGAWHLAEAPARGKG